MTERGKKRISVTVPSKSIPLAIILTLLFGPLGLFYSTVTGAIIMFFTTLLVSILTFGFGFLFTWPVCVIWAYRAVKKQNNKKIEEEF